jgi:hypothetical protein
MPILFKMIPESEKDRVKMHWKMTVPQDTNYHSFSRVLIEMAGERAYDHQSSRGKDDMDCSTLEDKPEDAEKYSTAEWEEYQASQTEEEWEEYLSHLGQGKNGKGGKGNRGRTGKGTGKGCHWRSGDHLKKDCPEFAKWKKAKDAERAAKGLPPFVPKGGGRGTAAAGSGAQKGRSAPLKSFDAENIEEDGDYMAYGFGMLDATSENGSDNEADACALDVSEEEQEEDYVVLDEEEHESAPEILALDDSGSDGEGDDDDGDFRELPAFKTPTKFA